jgi:hypothetical protein
MGTLTSFLSWCAGDGFYQQYAGSLRSPLFVAFFLLGSALFAVQALLVVSLKREVYDSEAYRRLLAIQRVVNPGLAHYGPLRRLSTLLLATSLTASAAAALQLTIGLIPSNLAALACVGSALAATSLLAFVPFVLRANLRPWLQQLEKDAILGKSRGGSASFNPPSGGSASFNPSSGGRAPVARPSGAGDVPIAANPPSGGSTGGFSGLED